MKTRMIPRYLKYSLTVLPLLWATLAHIQAKPLPPVFDKLELVEEIDATQVPADPAKFKEFPEGVSKVETVLNGKVRLLPNDKEGLKYFGYLIGKGKGLKANESYVLEIEYPEDKPRSIIVLNRGSETMRGFHTGNTLGDALKPRYVNNNPESLELPLSGAFEKCQMLMTLQERMSEIGGARQAEIPDPAMGMRNMVPDDGFWVYITQFEHEQDPLSQGAAISKIRLYKAPAFDDYALKINFPPKELPRRHLFFREEMADGVVAGEKNERGFDDTNNWYVGKAKLMRFLGMNTFAKDLLEFGANQGWDSSKFGGNSWVYGSKFPKRWEGILDTAKKYDLSVLPYYEYAGSKGDKGLGKERRAIPLNGDTYTHIKWAESARADLTDPDTFEDFRKMLEITIVDLKDRADFVGAWLRPRMSQLPVSFSDKALKRFTDETKQSKEVTRGLLLQDKKLYGEYITWWKGVRKEFLDKVVAYLRDSGVKDALVIYTADTTEPGAAMPGRGKDGVVAEKPELFNEAGLKKPPVTVDQAIRDHWTLEALTLPRQTWGNWEWQHAVPGQDPENYKNNQGVLPTYSFSRAYTVGDPTALEAFENPSGMAMIRHFSLNENMLRIDKGKDGKDFDPLGYFVADMELAGPFIMLGEARAMANGNPTQIGYLASNNFNRTFPQYVRNFNSAFLALPALPSKKVEGAASDPEVVVKKIDGGSLGTWFAVVNPGYLSKEKVTIHLPVTGSVTNAATGEEIPSNGGSVTLDFYPCQLISLHVH